MRQRLRWLVSLLVMAVLCTVGIGYLGGIASAAPVELRIWGWVPGSLNGDLFIKYIQEFEAAHPNIKINNEKGAYENQFLVAFAAGTAPDVVQGTGSWATNLGSKGMLMSLDSFIDGPKGFSRKDYIDDLWTFSKISGQTYQLAIDSNERALFVAMDAANNSGVDVKQGVRDWNDLLNWARKMTYKVGDQVKRWGFDMHQENGGNRWHWIWLNEGELFTPDYKKSLLNHPNTVAALKFAGDMVNQYGVSPRPGTVKGSSQSNFISGNYGMIITASQALPGLQKANKEYYTIPGPPGPGKTGYRFSGASASTMSIVAGTKHPEEAWTFVRWMAYEKGVEFANDRGGIPYLKKGLRDERFFKQPWQSFATSILTYGPRSPYMVGVSESDWTPQFQAAWDSVLKGEKGSEIVLQQAQESIDARLKEIQAR